MRPIAAIRREDKNLWEKRVPLTPDHIGDLTRKGVDVLVQPSPIRAYGDSEYAQAGAKLDEDLSSAKVLFAVKEIPEKFYREGLVLVSFAHVHKGQPYNMPMLQAILDKKCTLIDYERVAEDSGRRLIFFGRYAGIAGAIESLRALGGRLKSEGFDTPFSRLRQPHKYENLDQAKFDIDKVGLEIKNSGLPEGVSPLVLAVAGYGNVSKGVQEILNILPIEWIEPEELAGLADREDVSAGKVYGVIFKEEHTVRPVEGGRKFELQDFYDHPEKYLGMFDEYIEHITVLFNCIYWEEKYPRLLTKARAKDIFEAGKRKLKVIGDISADIEGGIEVTVKYTAPDAPNFVYDPRTEEVTPGVKGEGIVIMAIDNLPCELPRDSSREFSAALSPFAEAIVKADYTEPFNSLDLPPEVKRAVIVYNGELTPDYKYLKGFLQ